MQENDYKLIAEMIDYIGDNEIIDYYQFVQYAKENREDWYNLLRKRNVARNIGACIKSYKYSKKCIK